MAVGILGPFNDVINKTAAEMLDSQIFPKAAKVIGTFVNASFDAASSVVTSIRDMTKPAPPSSSA